MEKVIALRIDSNIQPKNHALSFDSNGEDDKRDSISKYKRLCFIGDLAQDEGLRTITEFFNLPIVNSNTGLEYAEKDNFTTVFIMKSFEGSVFENLYKNKQPILGPTALRQLAARGQSIPNNFRPFFNLAMSKAIICISGFCDKKTLAPLVPLIHHMGGSIRKDVSGKVTHLIANFCGGPKYQYAATFKLPILDLEWVYASWEKRYDLTFSATNDLFITKYKLKTFYGANIAFEGFSHEEETHMADILIENGGSVTNLDDPNLSHVVVDESNTKSIVVSSKIKIVKAEWFWKSVQKQFTQPEEEYLFDDDVRNEKPYIQKDFQNVINRASKRKRKKFNEILQPMVNQTPILHIQKSFLNNSERLSVSNSSLDCTISPEKPTNSCDIPVDTHPKQLTGRHLVFLELLQTESNYVGILNTIIKLFKNHLEEMPEEEALLNNTELNLIFGKIPPIYDVHLKILDKFKRVAQHWAEDKSIGNIIVRFSTELMKAYPPYINFFEEMKEVLIQCDQNKPRFHAFLKACQTRPECGRQSLQELMIRPVQRLGSISLLLNDILKNTPQTNSDYAALEQALGVLREIMTHINEDKKKTEGQVTLFNIFNEIDNCPPHLLSSHRSFITKSEVIQLSSTEGLSSKGNYLILFLFSDQLEVCKKKSKSFSSLKSSAVTISTQRNNYYKPYKHVRLIALNNIKCVIDIKETEDCQKVFSLVCRYNEDLKERLYTFAITDEVADKATFLKTVTKQMANNACTADADKFMVYLEPHQLNIDTSDLSSGTLLKAFKFAKTKMNVGRAFSFNKTPLKLKRAISSVASPIVSYTSLTTAAQLAQMKIASCGNINELGIGDDIADSRLRAPSSVLPTRKLKASSLGVEAMKIL